MGYSYRELSMCSFHIMFIDKVCCICLFAAVLCGCYCVDYRFFAGFVLPVWLRSNVLKVGLCWMGLGRSRAFKLYPNLCFFRENGWPRR